VVDVEGGAQCQRALGAAVSLGGGDLESDGGTNVGPRGSHFDNLIKKNNCVYLGFLVSARLLLQS